MNRTLNVALLCALALLLGAVSSRAARAGDAPPKVTPPAPTPAPGPAPAPAPSPSSVPVPNAPAAAAPAAVAPAAPPAPPAEVPWEQIEAWASGGAVEPAKVADVAKKPDPKPAEKPAPGPEKPAPPTPAPSTPPVPATLPPTAPPVEVKPAWTPPHPGERRPDPPSIAEYRGQFMRHDGIADRAEKSKDLERAFIIYYRMQRYTNALQELVAMKQDPKRFPGKDAWVRDRWFETGCMMSPPMPQRDLEANFAEWKTRNPQANPGDMALREKMITDKPSLAEFLTKREAQGDGDPNALWELCGRYQNNTPHDPLRYMSALIKLRDWFSELDQCKSGDVQWRLCNILSNDLELHKESADEAQTMIEKYPKNGSVTFGDALWMVAEGRRMQADDLHNKKEQIDGWRDAKRLYEEMRDKYPQNNHNKANNPGDKKTDVQHHIEELAGRLR